MFKYAAACSVFRSASDLINVIHRQLVDNQPHLRQDGDATEFDAAGLGVHQGTSPELRPQAAGGMGL
jgi:hypothetical protein